MADCLDSGRTWPELICLQKVTLSGQTSVPSGEIWSESHWSPLSRSCYERGTAVELLFLYSCFRRRKNRDEKEVVWATLNVAGVASECKSGKYHWLSIRLAWGKGNAWHTQIRIEMLSKACSLHHRHVFQISFVVRQKKLLSKFSFTGNIFPGYDKKKRRGTEGQ